MNICGMRAAVFPTRSPRVVMQKQFYMFPGLRLQLWMYFGFGRPCWGGYWRRGVAFLCFCALFWAMLHPRWWARHLHLGLCHLPTVVGLSVVALRWAPARTTTRCVSRRLLIWWCWRFLGFIFVHRRWLLAACLWAPLWTRLSRR